MESKIESSSRICPVTPGSKTGLNRLLKPRTIFMGVSLALILMTAGMVYLWMRPPPFVPPPPPPTPTPHGAIAIDGDVNFSDTALLEGWSGDGSPENPFIIDGLDIDLGGELGHGISISNTRVNFTISNCNLTGAAYQMGKGGGAGIYLKNVTNGELVNNTCFDSMFGIRLEGSHFYTVADNTCNSNGIGISLDESRHNTVANNTCNYNTDGIRLGASHTNIVMNNNCSSNNRFGIWISDSHSNTVSHNTCTSNTYAGIRLEDSHFNTVAYNIISISEDLISAVLPLIGLLVGITLLWAGWRMAKLLRFESDGKYAVEERL